MDLRRERRKVNSITGLIIIALFVLTAVALILFSFKSAPVDKVIPPIAEVGKDERAQKSQAGFFEKDKPKNSENEFTYKISSNAEFKGNESGNLKISNPNVNNNPMAVEIAQNDTQKVIFRSGIINIGEKIDNAALDVLLPVGKYECTAYICAMDPKSCDLLDFLEQPITIEVK
ncbi:MAG: hypothetical protein RR315_08360 [Oscillospiraceae bacterium]